MGWLGRRPLAPRPAAVQEESEGSEEAEEAEEPPQRLPAWLRRCCRPLPAGVVLPTVGAGLLVLLAGGVLLLAVAAALRPVAIEVVVREVAAGSLAGQLELLLCCLLVLPNAALWAVGYALGPGFWLGGDSLVAAGRAHLGAVPDFPLLVLAPEAGSAWQHLAQVVPVLAALTVAALLGRAAAAAGTAPADGAGVTDVDADGPWTNAATARTAAAVALLLAAAVTVTGWLAGGALGAGRMARLGPAAACGPAAAAWCLLLAVPGALAVRWWSLRRASAGRRTVSGRRRGGDRMPRPTGAGSVLLVGRGHQPGRGQVVAALRGLHGERVVHAGVVGLVGQLQQEGAQHQGHRHTAGEQAAEGGGHLRAAALGVGPAGRGVAGGLPGSVAAGALVPARSALTPQ